MLLLPDSQLLDDELDDDSRDHEELEGDEPDNSESDNEYDDDELDTDELDSDNSDNQIAGDESNVVSVSYSPGQGKLVEVPHVPPKGPRKCPADKLIEE